MIIDTQHPAWSIVMMARYNKVSNQRLYDACATLSDDDLHADRGAFFGSIFATLNHIMVGDHIWLGRLRDDLSANLSLTKTLYDDFADLSAARAALDAELETFAAGLTADRLATPWDYRDSAGNVRHDAYAICVSQLFNHQTHHRGQIHGMLTQAGVTDPPVFDMHRLLDGE